MNLAYLLVTLFPLTEFDFFFHYSAEGYKSMSYTTDKNVSNLTKNMSWKSTIKFYVISLSISFIDENYHYLFWPVNKVDVDIHKFISFFLI